MTNISIELSGPDFTTRFHNDWDVCESQGLLHVENLEGWYGGVGARTAEMTLAGQHGAYLAPTLRGPRSMTLVLTWVSSVDTGNLAYTRFSRFASGLAWDKGPYRMTVTEGDAVLWTDVHLDGEIQHQPINAAYESAFRVMIPLKADSFLYGPDRTTFLTPEGTGVGLEFDLFSEESGDGDPILTYGEYIDIDEVVTNLGNATAYPSFLVVGDFPGGVGLSVGRGTLEFPWPLVRRAPLQIDASGSAWIGATNVTARLSRRDFSAFQVRPGAQIAPAMYALQGGSGYCEMHTWDTYI